MHRAFMTFHVYKRWFTSKYRYHTLSPYVYKFQHFANDYFFAHRMPSHDVIERTIFKIPGSPGPLSLKGKPMTMPRQKDLNNYMHCQSYINNGLRMSTLQEVCHVHSRNKSVKHTRWKGQLGATGILQTVLTIFCSEITIQISNSLPESSPT